jgi:hypothetical protein
VRPVNHQRASTREDLLGYIAMWVLSTHVLALQCTKFMVRPTFSLPIAAGSTPRIESDKLGAATVHAIPPPSRLARRRAQPRRASALGRNNPDSMTRPYAGRRINRRRRGTDAPHRAAVLSDRTRSQTPTPSRHGGRPIHAGRPRRRHSKKRKSGGYGGLA